MIAIVNLRKVITLSKESQERLGERFREPLDNTLAKYQQAVRENPDDVSANVGLAETYTVLWCCGFMSRKDALGEARAAAERAVALDDSNGLAHMALGVLKLSDWDWEGAEGELKRAITLKPNEQRLRHWYALFLSAMGRHDEALIESKLSVALNPSPRCMVGYGSILYFAQDFEQLAVEMEAVIAAEPDYAPGYDWLGMAYVLLERYDESIKVYEKAATLSGRMAEILGGLGHAYGEAGRMDEAREILEELNFHATKSYVPPVQIAFVEAGLGNTDEMFKLLERAYREKSWELAFMREEPWFDHLHSDPRFVDLLARLKFPEKPSPNAGK